VIGFRGTEALSRPYVFEVFLQINGAEAHDLDFADAVGAKAALVASRDDDQPPFVFSGIFSEVSLLHEIEERAVLRAVLVPQLWRLSQTFHSCIYTQQSIIDIIESVLQDGGLTSDDYVLRLSGQYKPEEHVCQYRESHLDFISRWMEREGLYYFFEHAEEGEKLIITDSQSFHKELGPDPIRYVPQAGQDVSAGQHLQSFVCRHRQLPASVRFKDHDYNKPTLDVSGSAAVSKSGLGEINLHGARLFTPDAAKRMAKLRAEGLQARERVFTAAGTAFYLRSGNTFSLTDHPRSAFDTSYLAIEVEHQGNQMAGSRELRQMTGLDTDEVYRVDVTAIAATTQFRAEEKIPWPRIYGTEHGVVDGEADSEYAQIDDHGRYSVRFAFDESDLKDGKASTWVRMMQPHGGGVEGWHFPLRKATEVLFTFLGGDPDRPVIAGVVPNALTPSPVTRANHTRNVIQTGGRNRIEMEDKAGYERITISTPYEGTMIRMGSPNFDHELIVRTNKDALLETGGKWDVRVTGQFWEEVKGPTIEKYFNTKNVLVTGNLTQEHSANHKITVNGRREETYAHQKTVVQSGRNEYIVGGTSQSVVGDKKLSVSGSMTQVIEGQFHQTVKGAVNEVRTDAHLSLTVGATSDTFIGVKHSTFVGGQLNLTAAALVNLKLATELNVTVGEAALIKVANELNVVSGTRISISSGMDLKLNNALSLTLAPTSINEANLALKQAATDLICTSLLVVS